MNFRTVKVSDYDIISPVINDWWGGRQMADLLPKLFFVHFNNTSFVAEEDGKIVGFLIGFLSQTFPEEAYIHFVGVDPDYRKQKIGRQLYGDVFFSREGKRPGYCPLYHVSSEQKLYCLP